MIAPRWIQPRVRSQEAFGFLPEFGNLWPLYLMAGSIGLWYWNSSRKA